MKKAIPITITITILTVVAYIVGSITPVWALVEFILYLVKDRPFNWLSVWLFAGCLVYVALFQIVVAYRQYKKTKRSLRHIRQTGDLPKSKFQQRLHNMAEERGMTI